MTSDEFRERIKHGEPVFASLHYGRGDSPLSKKVDLDRLTRYEKAIVKFCDTLKANLLAKYRKGNRAHGGKLPTKVDCQREVNQEVLDIINYFLIDKVNGGET